MFSRQYLASQAWSAPNTRWLGLRKGESLSASNPSGDAVTTYAADNSSMTLALMIPTVGIVILFIYFAVQAASADPWGRKKRD